MTALDGSSSEDNLVASGVFAGSTLEHDLKHFLLGALTDLEVVLKEFLALSAVDPDLELTIGGVHGGGVNSDVESALDALGVAVNVVHLANDTVEGALDVADVDVGCIDLVDLLSI